MLMETLDSFESLKAYDEGLGPIIEMWRKEMEKAYKVWREVAAGCCYVLMIPDACPRYSDVMPTAG